MASTPLSGSKRPSAFDSSLVSLEGIELVRDNGVLCFCLQVPRLVLRAGEFVGLVGDSGSGKSTLLDILGLILRPSKASRFEFGEFAGGPPQDVLALWSTGREAVLARLRRERIGYVLQTGGLLPFLSVEGNITLPLRMNGKAVDSAQLVAAAERMGLARYLRQRPDRLSGGERQRVAVLRALLNRPALVLADEPTAAVDKARARKIVADLASLARDMGSAIVMVTHDLDLVQDFADRIHRLHLTEVTDHRVVAVCGDR